MAEPQAPTNSALLDKLRAMKGGALNVGSVPSRPMPLPGGGAPTPRPTSPVGDMNEPMGNPVAYHLMQAINALVSGDPNSEENRAALEMFMMALVEIFDPSLLQASPGQAGPGMGQPEGPPIGASPMGGPMAPPMERPLGQTR